MSSFSRECCCFTALGVCHPSGPALPQRDPLPQPFSGPRAGARLPTAAPPVTCLSLALRQSGGLRRGRATRLAGPKVDSGWRVPPSGGMDSVFLKPNLERDFQGCFVAPWRAPYLWEKARESYGSERKRMRTYGKRHLRRRSRTRTPDAGRYLFPLRGLPATIHLGLAFSAFATSLSPAIPS